MNAAALRDGLSAMGVSCEIETQGKLAVIVTPLEQLDARTRRAIVALARSNGFTNVCLELPADAAVSRD